MTSPVCRYNGRDFTTAEMALIHELLALTPPRSRTALSIEFCRRVNWLKPDGGLKQMSARLAFLAMHRDGVLTLPPPRGKQSRPQPIVPGPETDPPAQVLATLKEARPLQSAPVFGGTDAGALWNAFIDRYHYLGYRPLSGSHLWSAPVLQEQFVALEGLGYCHLSDLSMRVLCPLALMEFVPVCPNHYFDFIGLSLEETQVFTPAGLPFLPSLSIALRSLGKRFS